MTLLGENKKLALLCSRIITIDYSKHLSWCSVLSVSRLQRHFWIVTELRREIKCIINDIRWGFYPSPFFSPYYFQAWVFFSQKGQKCKEGNVQTWLFFYFKTLFLWKQKSYNDLLKTAKVWLDAKHHMTLSS